VLGIDRGALVVLQRCLGSNEGEKANGLTITDARHVETVVRVRIYMEFDGWCAQAAGLDQLLNPLCRSNVVRRASKH
jgi:hypothetical protein